MLIKVSGDRKPWIDGAPREAGWEGEVDADLGKQLIDSGLAEKKMGRPAKKGEADDVDA